MKRKNLQLSGIGSVIFLFGAAAVILAILFSMLFSALVLKQVLPENALRTYSAVICGLSVFAACVFGCKKVQNQRIPAALGIASVYYAVTLLTKTIAFPGETSGLLPQTLTVYGTAILAALAASLNGKGRGKRRRTAISK